MSRPEFGLDCRVCAIFARQRLHGARVARPYLRLPGPYLRLHGPLFEIVRTLFEDAQTLLEMWVLKSGWVYMYIHLQYMYDVYICMVHIYTYVVCK